MRRESLGDGWMQILADDASEAEHGRPVVPFYRLEEADVLSQGPDAAAEGDEEHDHPHHN